MGFCVAGKVPYTSKGSQYISEKKNISGAFSVLYASKGNTIAYWAITVLIFL